MEASETLLLPLLVQTVNQKQQCILEGIAEISATNKDRVVIPIISLFSSPIRLEWIWHGMNRKSEGLSPSCCAECDV